MDILELAHVIFSKPPKNPNSIQLDFSDFISNDQSNDPSSNLEEYPSDPSKELFQQLLMIFTEGMKYFYGDKNGKVDLSTITQNDFDKINKYFNSFGFKIFYNILPINSDNDTYYVVQKKELKDHIFRLVSNGMVYIISFDYFIANSSCHF